jgi:hypothetical protein
MKARSLLRVLLWPALLVTAALGQTGLGTITGVVTDPTGAVIAAAQIEARNTDTGLTFTSASSETGNYSVTQLPLGRYDLTVNVAGFKRFSRRGLTVTAAQVMRLDLTLEVGSQAESVTVVGDASMLRTERSDLTHIVTTAQLRDLPLMPVNGATGSISSSGFRDPFALARLVPGTLYAASSLMVINGQGAGAAAYRVEGQVAGNTGFMAGFTHQTQPSVDAIEEVAVQTSNYSAEFGTVGGGVFNVTMKSGRNQFHGLLQDYAVNEILNAAQPYTGRKSSERRHDYTGQLGGPVIVPKLYDGHNRTFFLWNWEQYRNNTIVRTTSATVPIDAYRNGDFTQVLLGSRLVVNGVLQPVNVQLGTGPVGTPAARRDFIDPIGRSIVSGTLFDARTERQVVCNKAAFPSAECTDGSIILVRDPFPGNIIEKSRFDPVALKVLSLVPRPMGPNSLVQQGTNFQNPWVSHRTSEIPSLKLDHNLNDQQKLSFYWSTTGTESQYAFPNGNAEGLPAPITAARGTFIHARTIRLNYDYALAPSLLLHVGAGWSQQNFDDRAPVTDYDAVKELGLRGATLARNFPNFNVGSAGANIGGMSSLGPTGGIQTFGGERRPSGNVNLTWVRRNHIFKFGAEWWQDRYPNKTFTGAAGNYSFGGTTVQTALQGIQTSQGSTGFAFASFLMGDVNAVTLSVPISAKTSKQQWALFVQDNWKVTRKLTLDYGLRWDYGTYAREAHGRYGAFSATVPNPSAGGRLGATIYEAACNCNFADNYPYAIGPRLGAAYQINRKTVFRAGFGVVYNATGTVSGSATNSQSGGIPGFGQRLFQLSDGIPASVNPRWPAFDPGINPIPGSVGNPSAHLDPNSGRPSRQFQWSIGLQREIGRNIVVEATYVARRAVWTSAGGLAPVNSLSEEVLKRYGFTIGNQTDALLLRTQLVQLSPAQRNMLAAHGVGLPYSGYPNNQAVRNQLLPFPQYAGNISPSNAPLGKNWYDALQVVVTKRMTHNLQVNFNTTWSKTLDANDSPDIFNRALAKDLGFDVPFNFRLSVQYTIPQIRRGTPVIGNRILAHALGGWGTAWYIQNGSAPALGRATSSGAYPISNYLGRGPGGAQLKKDADGKPMNPWAVNWVDLDGKVHPEPLNVNCRCFDPAKTIALNPNAWESVPDGQWAADHSTIRWFRGIRTPNESANFSRFFRLGPEGKVTLYIRAEFQNVFNRLRLPSPTLGNYLQPPTFSQVTPGVYTGGFGTFGNITANGTGGQRTGTLIARIQF